MAVAAVLISMGAVLGRTTFLQLIIMGFIELIVYSGNNYLNEQVFMAADAGDSIFVHVFGAYFGLAVSYMLTRNKKYLPEAEDMDSDKISDTFAMIGEY